MILVTGGAGYLGCVLVEMLFKAGYEIKVVDPGWFPSGIKFIHNLQGGKPHPCIAISRQSRINESMFEGVTAVCHLGGLSNDPMADAFPEQNSIYNFVLSKEIAEMSKKAGVENFIFASTASVYDGIGNGEYECNWNHAPHSSGYAYSNAKLLAEKSIIEMASDNFKVSILRQGTLWGYSPRMRYDLVVNTMLRDGLISRLITEVIPENETPHRRPICHVKDCAQVYLDILKSPHLEPITLLNVVGENIDISKLADKVLTLLQQVGIRSNKKYVHVPKVRNYMATTLSTCTRHVPDKLTPDILEIVDNIYTKGFPESYHPETRNIDWLNLLLEVEKPFMI